MKTLKTILAIALLAMNQLSFAQGFFELNYGTDGNEFLYYTFENSSGGYISLGGQQEEYGPHPVSPLIIEIGENGLFLNENSISKTDTSYSYRYGFEKANGNYLLFGTLTDSVSAHYRDVSYVCEMTPGLELVWEKMHPLPEPYIHHTLINYLMDADSNTIIQGKADSSLYVYNDLLFTMVIDKNGNRLDFNFYGGWKDYGVYNDMLFNHDSTAIEFFGNYVRPIAYSNDWIEMNLNLEITQFISTIDEDHDILDPVSVQTMGTDRFAMANVAIMEPGAYLDLYVKIMDTNFVTLKDTLILYPERTSLTGQNGLGFIDPENIWIPTFEDNTTNFMGTEVFRFHLFDSNLHLKAMKEYGGDTRYWFYNMLVTSDGGCLLTGVVPDYEGSLSTNGYLIKVMHGDILTHAEETPFENDKDVMVFPNPFSTEIRVQTTRKGLVFNLADIAGRKILSREIDNIPDQTLTTDILGRGTYFYSIQYENRIIQSGKLIKK
ncbi:MAG: T9SS type A sorting domain-containing protein [Chlorobi bacterium]|nr:T9SS type A sorting domain-containing protein [Chlorobiota bacterium]